MVINETRLTKKIRYWVGGIGVSIISILFCLIILELGARGYRSIVGEKITDHWEFRALPPLPYQNAPYFSQEFLIESSVQPEWYTPQGTSLVFPKDFHGKFYNTYAGKRRTAFQPDVYENTVYLFGGSTIYNSEVPDEYTVASQLQILFLKKFDNQYRVENLGVTSVNISQQVERLYTINLNKGDIVIFFDGANDILQSIYYNNPNGWIVQTNRDAIDEMSSYTKIVFFLYNQLYDKSELVNIFFSPYNLEATPDHLDDQQKLAELLVGLRATYESKLIEASDYTQKGNAIFFHFLQPNLFTLAQKSQYESDLLRDYSNTHIIPGGVDNAVASGYPVLKTVIQDVTKYKINSFDISDAFDNRPSEEEIFLDWIHVNHFGNQLIANRIFEKIIETDLLANPVN